MRSSLFGNNDTDPSSQSIDPELAEMVVQDVHKAITTLEMIHGKCIPYGDNDIKTFTITVHGMKGLFATIGEAELSANAARLEKAAHEKDIAIMSEETEAFIARLRNITKKFKPEYKTVMPKSPKRQE